MKIYLSIFYKIVAEPFKYYIHWCADFFWGGKKKPHHFLIDAVIIQASIIF